MTVFFHELRRGRVALIIWTLVIALMLAVDLLVFPVMAASIDELNGMMEQMGELSGAFGMDKVDIARFTGYFATQCASVLGVGGALYAALMGVSALAGEEKEHTAEFLLTHPVSRASVAGQKLLSIIVRLAVVTIASAAAAVISMLIIGETADGKTMFLIFLANFLMFVQIACVTFGLSAFIRNGGVGISIGLVLLLYFASMLPALVGGAKAIGYFTPFAYSDGPTIAEKGAIDTGYLLAGAAFALVGAAVGIRRFCKKDIAG